MTDGCSVEPGGIVVLPSRSQSAILKRGRNCGVECNLGVRMIRRIIVVGGNVVGMMR